MPVADLDNLGPDQIVALVLVEHHLQESKEASTGIGYLLYFAGEGDAAKGCCGQCR